MGGEKSLETTDTCLYVLTAVKLFFLDEFLNF